LHYKCLNNGIFCDYKFVVLGVTAGSVYGKTYVRTVFDKLFVIITVDPENYLVWNKPQSWLDSQEGFWSIE
jgi:hypothetical protein